MSTNTEASPEPIQKGGLTICKQSDGSSFGQKVAITVSQESAAVGSERSVFSQTGKAGGDV